MLNNVTESAPDGSSGDSKTAEDGSQKRQYANDNNTDYVEEKETGQRRIGKWFIKETLGKGGYSWVKRGVDCDNQRVFALKFMERRKGKDDLIRKSQRKQVETEIEVLRRVGKADHIIRLFAYNLNQKYPDRNGTQREVILLVLEYAPGGELFDLLYYTDTLEPILARTYFRQLCSGVQCLHKLGVIHRDLKPQNLLLDEHYNLKITDFGLSKILKDNGDVTTVKLTNPCVGTKGYQAPEIVRMNNTIKLAKANQQDPGKALEGMYYTASCDIFAMGVVLFILMTGYPPFKQADHNDKWYKYIVKGDYQSFWRAHRNSGLNKSETDLITRMLLYDLTKRISMTKICNHPWYKDDVLSSTELEQVLALRHQEMELKRSMDDTKQQILQPSDRVMRPLMPNFEAAIVAKGYSVKRKAPALPDNVKPNMVRDIYTTCEAYEVLQEIRRVIENDMRGILVNSHLNEIFDDRSQEDEENQQQQQQQQEKEQEAKEQEKGDIDIDNFCLTATIAHLKQEEDEEEDAMNMEAEGIKLHIQLYWVEQKNATLVQFNVVSSNKDPFASNKQDFWERKRMINQWRKLKNHFIEKAAHVLTGLPKKQRDDQQQDADQQAKIDALYKKCFPEKQKKSNVTQQ